MIEVYTDGACEKNPGGRGGWGWVVDEQTFGYGGNPSTTNQRMEVVAAIEALESLPVTDLRIVTDSEYTMNCATGKWKRKANTDLWKRLDLAMRPRADVLTEYQWVRGHSGVRLNEVADRLAYIGMTGGRVDSDVLTSPAPPPSPTPAFEISATRPGRCCVCADAIHPGMSITQVRQIGWLHVECFAAVSLSPK